MNYTKPTFLGGVLIGGTGWPIFVEELLAELPIFLGCNLKMQRGGDGSRGHFNIVDY